MKALYRCAFYLSYIIDTLLNIETLLARVWGWENWANSPTGKQRLYIQVLDAKRLFGGCLKITDVS